MSAQPVTPIQDRIASMVHAFSDEHRKYAVRLLAHDVGEVEKQRDQLAERVKRLEEARTLASANSLANMLTHEDALAKIQAIIREGNKLEAIVRRDYGGAYCDEWTKAKGQG